MTWLLKISRPWAGIALFLFLVATGTARGDDRQIDPLHSENIERRVQRDYSPFPQPDAGYVSDHANILSDDAEERIEQWLWQVEKKTGVEIIVMSIYSIEDYPGTPNGDIETFATALFDKYGIGNMPQNDGVLLLVSVKDRKVRIELGGGYGSVRDRDARRLINDIIVPAFKGADYGKGTMQGVKAIALEFAGTRIGPNWPLIFSLSAVPILGLIALSLFISGKRGWGWVCVGFVFILILFIFYLFRKAARFKATGPSDSWSAGGAGGFGGGFSGGGGATGDW